MIAIDVDDKRGRRARALQNRTQCKRSNVTANNTNKETTHPQQQARVGACASP
jgi:hypothetical protein